MHLLLSAAQTPQDCLQRDMETDAHTRVRDSSPSSLTSSGAASTGRVALIGFLGEDLKSIGNHFESRAELEVFVCTVPYSHRVNSKEKGKRRVHRMCSW